MDRDGAAAPRRKVLSVIVEDDAILVLGVRGRARYAQEQNDEATIVFHVLLQGWLFYCHITKRTQNSCNSFWSSVIVMSQHLLCAQLTFTQYPPY